ncbi:MAG: aminopeptidase P family N-terminal domain-containing protein, partial [Pseudomonadota bacterium]
MFQTFENIADPSKGKGRVTELRKALRARKLAAFLVPRADEYQNEYTPPNAERLFWLTGFSGSAGSTIVGRKSAALFVDGRYTLQASQQVDTKVFEILQVPQNDPADWLKKALKKGDALGYDPRLHTIKAVERLKKTAKDIGATLAPQGENPVDAMWTRRPAPPQGAVSLHPLEYAGVAAKKKIAAIQKDLRKAKVDAVVLTAPESICWLLNIRGQDVPHTPLVLCSAIVPAKGPVELFINLKKISPAVRKHLKPDASIRREDDLAAALAGLGEKNACVQVDPNQASQWFADRLSEAEAEIVHKPDPCMAPKAKKNAVEIAGARSAHLRDGAAVCRFLAWLDANAKNGKLDEIGAAKKLEAFRAQT